jgi:hypothetical protein
MEIGTERDELGRHRSSDRDAARVSFSPMALELKRVTVVPRHFPGMLGRRPLDPVQYFVRHTRTAIWEAAERV